MTSACLADVQGSIPRQGNYLFLWYLYVYCTSIIWFHVSIHQYTSFHLPKYHWCSGVNTCLPSRRVGFNPQRGLTFVIFCWNCPSHGRILEKTYQNDLQIALVNLRKKIHGRPKSDLDDMFVWEIFTLLIWFSYLSINLGEQLVTRTL